MARVLVDVPLAHLDRPFDYLVPERLAESAVPGCRVRVRFAGQLVGGYLLDRVAVSEHQGRLAALERVVSPEPVLTPEITALAREVADRYAGTMADVLRLAIPPRHARRSKPDGRAGRAGAGAGPELNRAGARLQRGRAGAGRGPRPGRGPATRQGRRSWRRWPDRRAPRAVWSALPGPGLAGGDRARRGHGGRRRPGGAHRGPGRTGPETWSTPPWPGCSGPGRHV